jgi:hypothetical protein
MKRRLFLNAMLATAAAPALPAVAARTVAAYDVVTSRFAIGLIGGGFVSSQGWNLYLSSRIGSPLRGSGVRKVWREGELIYDADAPAG